MRPLKPEQRRAILERFDEAQRGEIQHDIEEYEALLSQRLRQDPEVRRSPAGAAALHDQRQRIAELRSKLFGSTEAVAAER